MIGSKWKHGIIPSLLIHCSIGTIYCWSLLAAEIEKIMGDFSNWAFSIAIFCIGISAALFGPVVEKHLKGSVFTSAVLFSLGMILSGVACSIGSFGLLCISYGVLMGIGIGIGYLAPIKTLILWFGKNKGLAVGLAIMGFGLAKIFAAPGFSYFLKNFDITTLFVFHGVLYGILMLLATWLIKKPSEEDYKGRLTFKIWKERLTTAIKAPGLWVYWVIFFFNITAGLAIISYEELFFRSSSLALGIGFCLSMCAVFNSVGRFGVAWVSDVVFNRGKLFGIILTISVLTCILGFLVPSSIPFTVLICNLGYGAMFSLMPSAISDRYGNDNISEIHGITLSAWAFSGLVGTQLARLIISLPESTHKTLILMAGVIYAIGLYFSVKVWSNNSNQKITVEKGLNS